MALDTEIFRQIESAQFAWELGLSGSRARAVEALIQLPQTKGLLVVLREDPDAAYDVANRFVALIQREIDPQYTHPADAAIAAYLRALDILNPALASALAPMAAHHRENLWWSVPVVDSLLRGPVRVEDASATWAAGTDLRWLDQGQAIRRGSVRHGGFIATGERVVFPPVPQDGAFKLIAASARVLSDADQVLVNTPFAEASYVSARSRAHNVERDVVL